MSALGFKLLGLIAQLLLQIFAIIFLPAVVIKYTRKDLSFWTAMVASLWLIFMPIVYLFNTRLGIDSLYTSLWGWGVSQLKTFHWLCWTFTSGALCSSVYCSLLMGFDRGVGIRNNILGFLWLSIGLYAISQVLIPIVLFGDFGWQLAREETTILAINLILAVSTTAYVCLSDNCKKLFC